MKFIFLFLISVSYLPAAAEKIFPEKILIVRVYETGVVTVNSDTVDADALVFYIQERLFKSFLGTGKMHNRIKLEKASTSVSDLVTETIIKEIKDAQLRTLANVCLQKYNRNFNSLEKKRQDKLKKQFPVLFQTDYF